MTRRYSVCIIVGFAVLLALAIAVPVIADAPGSGAGIEVAGFVTAADSISPPATPTRLIFIHHSCGENWLGNGNGNLGISLRDNNYYVSDTNYGWGPDGIGSSTDIGNWWDWFRGPSSSTYLAALYAEDGQNCSYSRMATSPGGENQIIMFKSCFPNSALKGNPSDPVPSIDSNPLRGQGSGSAYHTVANAKGIYIDLLEYFKTRLDKLFVVITAPPLQDGTYAANARAFNNWLVNDWLAAYPYNNVFVFDFYNVLTSNGGSPAASDFNWETGNHHRWLSGVIQHKTDGGGNTLAYPSGGDDHPNSVGNQKATGEYLPLLNVAYNRRSTAAPHIDSISPSSGPVGTEVTVNGSSFGSSRGSSYVSLESTHMTQYNEWSDSRIRCLVPAGSLSGWLTVTTSGGVSNTMNYVIPLPSVASRFYFAEGYTGDNFNEWLCLLNRDAGSARAQVTYMYADGAAPFTRDYPLPGDSRVTVNVNDAVGAGRDVSIKLESDGHVLAERPMYFNYNGVWSGGHDVIGAPEPSNNWYFAEGYTGSGFDEWICVLNPGSTAAGLTFRFQTEGGEVVKDGYDVPAHSRRTFKANDILGPDYQTSLAVEASQEVVVERPIYFDYLGRGNRHWAGGHCVMGATGLNNEYYFAEGTTRSGFESWLTLQNPNAHAITVNAFFQLGPGQGDPVERSFQVAAASRYTVFLADQVGSGKDVSVKLTSSENFLAERPMYFSYHYGVLSAEGGHCVIGAFGPSDDWLFAEGYTGAGFNEWLCLQNPGDGEAVAEITYYTQEAGTLPVKSVSVPARTRVTVVVNEQAGGEYQLSVSVHVVSGPPIVAERPMYFMYGAGWDGGHDVVGFRSI